jgi:hypothetical protein
MLSIKKSYVATAMVVAAIAATTATAALAGGLAADGKGKAGNGQHLNGTWMSAVTLTDAPPVVQSSFTALDTFLPGGGLLVSSSVDNPSVRSLAHGTWTRTGDRTFSSTFTWFRFDPTGKYVGLQRVRRTMTVSADLASFSASDVIEILSPAGAVLATIHGTEEGKKLD